MREQLAKKFSSINLDEFEKYKRETLSPLLNMPSQGMELNEFRKVIEDKSQLMEEK